MQPLRLGSTRSHGVTEHSRSFSWFNNRTAFPVGNEGGSSGFRVGSSNKPTPGPYRRDAPSPPKRRLLGLSLSRSRKAASGSIKYKETNAVSGFSATSAHLGVLGGKIPVFRSRCDLTHAEHGRAIKENSVNAPLLRDSVLIRA